MTLTELQMYNFIEYLLEVLFILSLVYTIYYWFKTLFSFFATSYNAIKHDKGFSPEDKLFLIPAILVGITVLFLIALLEH